MRILRRIQGKTLHDRIRNEDIRQPCDIPHIGRWVRQRRRFRNKHIERMEDNRLVKKANMNNPEKSKTAKAMARMLDIILGGKLGGNKQALT